MTVSGDTKGQVLIERISRPEVFVYGVTHVGLEILCQMAEAGSG